jgi:putative peptide zinc metalloprotease protein
LALIVTALSLAVLDPRFPRLTGRPAGVVEAVLIGTASVALHELSHCYAASCRGITSGTLKAQLYLGVVPIVGLKLAGLYTLRPRGRLAVWSAGILFNLAAASVAMLALRTVAPASSTLQTAAAFNWFLVVLNLMPLLPTDGYFLLSTLTRESNVRVRAWSWLRRPLKRGRHRPSLFVLAYILATVGLLVSTLWRLVGGIVGTAARSGLWRAASVARLVLFLVTLWRTLRRTEESGDA